MENAIIIGIVVVLILIGIRSGIKHFKGEGGCCGGGSTVKDIALYCCEKKYQQRYLK
ncbi:MAG: hypothetical protein IJO97_05440 [Lachnospiraceae bacterium]|nr:hypothetical protein [Lachnospiraceae bacterium]